jgi:hypothetical protein
MVKYRPLLVAAIMLGKVNGCPSRGAYRDRLRRSGTISDQRQYCAAIKTVSRL